MGVTPGCGDALNQVLGDSGAFCLSVAGHTGPGSSRDSFPNHKLVAGGRPDKEDVIANCQRAMVAKRRALESRENHTINDAGTATVK